MLNDIGKMVESGFTSVAKGVDSLLPWNRASITLEIKQVGLTFISEIKGVDDLSVKVFKGDQLLVHLEGKNNADSEVATGLNIPGYSADLLQSIFHMARCWRNFQLTEKVEFSKEFGSFRKKVISGWRSHKTSWLTRPI